MERFDHEKLDVYNTAVDWVVLAQDIVSQMPQACASANLAEQLQRAAASITLNIAEGAGEYSPKEKARFYRIAKRSATECAAVLDVAQRRNAIHPKRFSSGRDLLLRIVAMLVKLSRART
jgi:four helix bundle protein